MKYYDLKLSDLQEIKRRLSRITEVYPYLNEEKQHIAIGKISSLHQKIKFLERA